MPVFFAAGGADTDLAALARPELLVLTALLIVLASVGKFPGAFLGGRIGGLTLAESFAVGCGMNARGSTEVIVASIGLSMGALNQRLFSAIVAMAVITTMAMPPMLRWALKASAHERRGARAARARGVRGARLSRAVERLLVAVDASAAGSWPRGWPGSLAGVRRIPTTVLHLDAERPRGRPPTRPPRSAPPRQRAPALRRDERAAKGAAKAA